jgi:hypothetical protein
LVHDDITTAPALAICSSIGLPMSRVTVPAPNAPL